MIEFFRLTFFGSSVTESVNGYLVFSSAQTFVAPQTGQLRYGVSGTDQISGGSLYILEAVVMVSEPARMLFLCIMAGRQNAKQNDQSLLGAGPIIQLYTSVWRHKSQKPRNCMLWGHSQGLWSVKQTLLNLIGPLGATHLSLDSPLFQ